MGVRQEVEQAPVKIKRKTRRKILRAAFWTVSVACLALSSGTTAAEIIRGAIQGAIFVSLWIFWIEHRKEK
jgi:ABC-type amino acid transport system permease subunit